MPTTKSTSYGQLTAELDEVLAAMQNANGDIDAAMKAYEKGMGIIAELQTYLDTAEVKVTKLRQQFEQAG